MEQDLRGAAAPGPDPARPLPPRRPLIVCAPLRFWLIEVPALRVVIHWDEGCRRSSRCRIDAGEALCEGCEYRFPKRVLWYVQVWPYSQRGAVELLTLTPKGIQSCPRIEAADGLLPGTLIETGRRPEQPFGQQYIRVLREAPPARLPLCHPTAEVLERLWARPNRPELPPRPEPRPKRPRLYPAPPPEESDPLTEGL